MNADEFSQKNINHPIFDGTFFTIKKIDNDNVRALCISCNNETVVISGSIQANSNFRTHIKRINKDKFEDFQTYLKSQPRSSNRKICSDDTISSPVLKQTKLIN